jgi:hypothetical protein
MPRRTSGEAPYYIYALTEPITKIIRYVGASNQPQRRYWEHWSHGNIEKSRKGHWIEALKTINRRPGLILLERVEPGEDWRIREAYWIHLHEETIYNHYSSGDVNQRLDPSPLKGRRASRKLNDSRPKIRRGGWTLNDQQRKEISERVRIPDEVEDRIQALLSAGLSSRQIGNIIGVSKSTVNNVRKRNANN